MPAPTAFSHHEFRYLLSGSFRGVLLLLLGIALVAVLLFGELPESVDQLLVVLGLSSLFTATLMFCKKQISKMARANTLDVLKSLSEQDTTPTFVTNPQGSVQFANAQARQCNGVVEGKSLDDCLQSVFANPSAILFRLQSTALMQGRAQEDVVTKAGTVPVTAHVVGRGLILWRVATGADNRNESSLLPILTIGRDDVILGVNGAARDLIDCGVGPLDQVFTELPVRHGEITRIRTPQGTVPVVASDIRVSGVCREMVLLPLKQLKDDQDSATFAELPIPVMRLSPDGDILEANRLARQLIGGTIPSNANIQQIMQGLGRPLRSWLRETAEKNTVPHSEFLRLTRKDKELFLQVTLTRTIRNGDVNLIAVLNDATELKSLEAQFVQSQKMQAVGQLAGGVAHDFNNLLTAISGHCDLLLLRHDQNDPNYADLIQINQNANRAAALVGQLLAFSRKQTLQPEVLDLRDTISDLVHLLNRLVGEKITLTLSHDPVLRPVRADKRQLEQVLMNLVVNARDAMPQGGEIRIESDVVRLEQPMQRDRATLPVGEYVTVKVTDEGIGIPPGKLQKVFEPFYTTKRTGEGTGLGLSTAYGIVKQTGGFIFVDSIEGKGSVFTLFLPACVEKLNLPEAPQSTQPSPGMVQGEGVVLLVEDEAPVRAFASRALRLRGYTVLEADSGEEALRLLDDKDLSVDVFVTDVVMPGMDGPSWVRKALDDRPHVRVVFMSGYTEGAFGDTGPDVLNSVFLPKPFSLNQLTETVYQQLQ